MYERLYRYIASMYTDIGSECINRLVITRFDIRMRPMFSVLNTYVNTTLDTL